MNFPFKIIESNIAHRNEFDVTDGYQPTHALFYLKEGSFDIEIDGKVETVCAGDCLILPDYLHFRRNVINPIEFVFVKFVDNPSCLYSFSVPYGKVDFDDAARFSASISLIEHIIDREDAFSVSYREHLLMDILFQLAFKDNKGVELIEGRAPRNPQVISAVAYIRENLDKKILIEDLCRVARSNSSTLNFNFRRELNTSVYRFILDERMKRARRLLIATNYSISEIAARCGFENVYYFSNAFKKSHGVPPSEYKREKA